VATSIIISIISYLISAKGYHSDGCNGAKKKVKTKAATAAKEENMKSNVIKA